jgi:hypothetical protein
VRAALGRRPLTLSRNKQQPLTQSHPEKKKLDQYADSMRTAAVAGADPDSGNSNILLFLLSCTNKLDFRDMQDR